MRDESGVSIAFYRQLMITLTKAVADKFVVDKKNPHRFTTKGKNGWVDVQPLSGDLSVVQIDVYWPTAATKDKEQKAAAMKQVNAISDALKASKLRFEKDSAPHIHIDKSDDNRWWVEEFKVFE